MEEDEGQGECWSREESAAGERRSERRKRGKSVLISFSKTVMSSLPDLDAKVKCPGCKRTDFTTLRHHLVAMEAFIVRDRNGGKAHASTV